MKSLKTMRKLGLSMFFALVMCFGLLQVDAFAADDLGTEPPAATETKTEPSTDASQPNDTAGSTPATQSPSSGSDEGTAQPENSGVTTENSGPTTENSGSTTENSGSTSEDPGSTPETPDVNPGETQQPSGGDGETEQPGNNGGEDPGETPENPGETPENPGDDSENPGDDPENPGEDPDDPENPENPDDPENPGDDSENPENPENPDDPENPENPENPDDPENPENPDDPEDPDVTPENPGGGNGNNHNSGGGSSVTEPKDPEDESGEEPEESEEPEEPEETEEPEEIEEPEETENGPADAAIQEFENRVNALLSQGSITQEELEAAKGYYNSQFDKDGNSLATPEGMKTLTDEQKARLAAIKAQLESIPWDLKDYLDPSNQNGTITTVLTDASGAPLPKDEDGNIYVTPDTEYKLAVQVQSPNGFLPHSYSYDLPKGVAQHEGTGNLQADSTTTIGTWNLHDGKLILNFNEKAEDYSNVIVSAVMSITFEDIEKIVDFEGDVQVTIRPNGKPDAGLVKDGWRNLKNTTNQAIGWKFIVTGGEDFPIIGQTIQDRFEIYGDNDYFPHQVTSYPLVTVNGGTKFRCADGSFHTWSTEDSVIPVMYEGTGYITGWDYTMPGKVTCAHCGKEIVLKDEYTYTFGYFSDPINPPQLGTIQCENTVTIGEKSASDIVPITYGIKGTNISKTVQDNPNGVAAKDWTIQVKIPSGTNADGSYSSYLIWDRAGVLDANDTILYGPFSYDDMMETSSTHFVNNLKVQVKYEDGEDITVIDAVEYNGGLNPNETQFVYILGKAGDGFTITLGMPYDSNIKHSAGCANDEKFCTCWTFDKGAMVEVTYTTPDEVMLPLMNQYGGMNLKLTNQAILNLVEKDYHWYDIGNEKADVPLNTIFSKDLNSGNLPGASNDYTAQYTIKVNEAHLKLDVPELKIEDVMNNLDYVHGTIRVTATEKATTTEKDEKQQHGASSVLDSTEYSVEWDAENHKLYITIPVSLEDTRMFTINYDAVVSDPKKQSGFSNSASVDIFGQTFTKGHDPKIVSEVGSIAETFSILVKKVDKANTDIVLSGAEFGLYEAETGKEITSGATGGDGYWTAKTSVSKKIILKEHTLYYIQETKAPDNYLLDDTFHYFYFCKSGDCDECAKLNEYIRYAITGETMTVGNEKKPDEKPEEKPDEDPDDPDDPETPDTPGTPEEPEEPSNPDSPSRPSRDPEPTPEIPDEDVPLSELPDEEVPLAEIPEEDIPLIDMPEEDIPLAELPEEDVPLAELPEEDVPLAEIPEEDVPLAEIPSEDVPTVEIPEQDVPMTDVPRTGDNSNTWTILMLLSMLGLSVLTITRKKENA